VFSTLAVYSEPTLLFDLCLGLARTYGSEELYTVQRNNST
jgi:hypothetical protein